MQYVIESWLCVTGGVLGAAHLVLVDRHHDHRLHPRPPHHPHQSKPPSLHLSLRVPCTCLLNLVNEQLILNWHFMYMTVFLVGHDNRASRCPWLFWWNARARRTGIMFRTQQRIGRLMMGCYMAGCPSCSFLSCPLYSTFFVCFGGHMQGVKRSYFLLYSPIFWGSPTFLLYFRVISFILLYFRLHMIICYPNRSK